jgi:hypothetical protein
MAQAVFVEAGPAGRPRGNLCEQPLRASMAPRWRLDRFAIDLHCIGQSDAYMGDKASEK